MRTRYTGLQKHLVENAVQFVISEHVGESFHPLTEECPYWHSPSIVTESALDENGFNVCQAPLLDYVNNIEQISSASSARAKLWRASDVPGSALGKRLVLTVVLFIFTLYLHSFEFL